MENKKRKLSIEKPQSESAVLLQYKEDLRQKDEEIAQLNECLIKLKSQTEEDLRKKDEEIAQLNECLIKLKSETESAHQLLHEDLRRKDAEIARLNELKVEASSDRGMNIHSLPDEILVKIFQNLELMELARIARVCKQWHELTRCPLLCTKVDIKFREWKDHKSQNKVVTRLWETFLTCTTHIKLDFFYSRSWEDSLDFEAFSQRLGTQCPSLRSLELRGIRFSVSLQSVVDLCSHCLPRLEVLTIHGSGFGDCSVKGEYNDHSPIRVLNISMNFYDSIFMSKFALFKMSSLRRLKLSDPNDDCFQGDIALGHLQYLDLSGSYIGSRTLQTLQTCAPHLTVLHLCETMVEDNGFSFHSTVFPQLKTVCLRLCDGVTCEGIVSLVRWCPSLQDVYVKEDVADSYATHPVTAANPLKLQIVKTRIFCPHN